MLYWLVFWLLEASAEIFTSLLSVVIAPIRFVSFPYEKKYNWLVGRVREKRASKPTSVCGLKLLVHEVFFFQTPLLVHTHNKNAYTHIHTHRNTHTYTTLALFSLSHTLKPADEKHFDFLILTLNSDFTIGKRPIVGGTNINSIDEWHCDFLILTLNSMVPLNSMVSFK